MATSENKLPFFITVQDERNIICTVNVKNALVKIQEGLNLVPENNLEEQEFKILSDAHNCLVHLLKGF